MGHCSFTFITGRPGDFILFYSLFSKKLSILYEVYIKFGSVKTIKTRKRTLIRKKYILNEIKNYEGEKNRFEFIIIYLL